MIHQCSLQVPLDNSTDQVHLRVLAGKELRVRPEDITALRIRKRSIDARSKIIKVHLQLDVYVGEEPPREEYHAPVQSVHRKPHVLIVGAGPAGFFAALRLIELGIKPIIVERGKDVQARRRDLAAINRFHTVNPESNYCFGEGGAGTYSDGKLYTRSTKRGDVRKVLELFVAHGAAPTILVDAHPHIGTNKLPQIIVKMRESILASGGEIHFNTCVIDFILSSNAIKGVRTADGQEFLADHVILATGHSARDIFELLHRKHIRIESKPFAMGVRIEHAQSLIDTMQYRLKSSERHPLLPPASYSWVEQVYNDPAQGERSGTRGVFSFCMCPGGIIAPCATAEGEVVTNGWSPSRRNNPFANSGVVVAINQHDLELYHSHGALAGLRFQQAVEQMAWQAGGKTQRVPAQRMVDFVEGKLSADLPETSYHPGIVSAPLHELLPTFIGRSLQDAFRALAKKMKPYYTNEAVLHGVESRTSSPVRTPRSAEPLEHPEIHGLYPCAEGAGYAGGIVSAAIDGQQCAEAIAKKMGVV